MEISSFDAADLYHYAKRAEVYGLDHETEVFRKHGWNLSQGGRVDEKEIQCVVRRLAAIPRFAKTCFTQDCPKCKKLVAEYGKDRQPQAWRLSLELYRWQKEAREIWKQKGGQGIIRVVTGAGKTILALSLMDFLYQKYVEKKLKTIIVVPTTALLDQWYENILGHLHIPPEEVGMYYGEAKDDLAQKRVMLYVINSARNHLFNHLKDVNQDVFLIVDECHRAGSTMNRKIFRGTYDYRLGLSATPERRGDYGFEEVLVKHLGAVIYSYSYSDARKDGIIPPYRLKRIAVPLTFQEKLIYGHYSDKIKKVASILFKKYPELEHISGNAFFKRLGRIHERTHDDWIEKYTILVNKRKGIVHTSESKILTLQYLIKSEIDTRARILIFHERTRYADRINRFLHQEGIQSAVYHTKIDPVTRRENLRKFKEGEINILITCRALDEGLDVPDTSVGIIVAATSSVRQRVQRIGRILRKAPGKDYSEIYTIYIQGIEDDIFSKRDLRILERSAQKIEVLQMGFEG
jgi:superfamily II DNA or RNA helicase